MPFNRSNNRNLNPYAVKAFISVIILLFVSESVWSQQAQMILQGKILDARTKTPLSRATVRVKSKGLELGSRPDGGFELSGISASDSLEISHIGYKTFKKIVGDISNPATILLEDYSIQLRTLTITSRKLSVKQIDNSLRRIKGNLYAYETETSNGLYTLFLNSLEEDEQQDLFKLCSYDLSRYDEKTKAFYKVYSDPNQNTIIKKDSLTNYVEFPVVNISHNAAVLFCQWLTEHYNSNLGKKKFTKVKFRLPSLNEWKIAALGYDRFQSWVLDENKVEVIIPTDTLIETPKGKKSTVSVRDISYPWYLRHYNYRKSPVNAKNCYLANFKAVERPIPCARGPLPNYDGWSKMSLPGAYFPNDMGLYDMIGNVAEMIDEKGKACGGSWDDSPSESTIRSVKHYDRPDDTIGFRVFMEVIEE